MKFCLQNFIKIYLQINYSSKIDKYILFTEEDFLLHLVLQKQKTNYYEKFY